MNLDPDSACLRILSGERRGLGAALTRVGLRTAAGFYAGAVGIRNAYYGRWAFPAWLEVPVISIGNLTVGGTGKTPMTIWMCKRLIERGRKPAVLSRGYKSESGIADELLLISRRIPQAVAIANPDRFAAGQLAVQEYGATAAVLDDGFQHRRVGRDLDIVLIDATRPFGFGHLLPRGLLREPVASLGRAEAVVITRADQCAPAELESIEQTVRGVHADVPIARAVHRPEGFFTLNGSPATPDRTRRLGAFAGVARPEAFRRTLESLGHAPTGMQLFPDHHAYTAAELDALARWARHERIDALVTTEKDAVKPSIAEFPWPMPLLVLRVEMELLNDGDKILSELIDTMLKDHEAPDEPRSTE